MAKFPIKTAGALIGLFDDSNGFVGAHLLRRRYNEACKDIRRAARAVDNCLNAKRRPALQEKLEKVRRYLEDVEGEVKRSWRATSTRRWPSNSGSDGTDE
jgi:hypothetical protein